MQDHVLREAESLGMEVGEVLALMGSSLWVNVTFLPWHLFRPLGHIWAVLDGTRGGHHGGGRRRAPALC